ncbi:hypothetical protein FA95DRAFT_1554750, partial [Auriscalpium vulgare]
PVGRPSWTIWVGRPSGGKTTRVGTPIGGKTIRVGRPIGGKTGSCVIGRTAEAVGTAEATLVVVSGMNTMNIIGLATAHMVSTIGGNTGNRLAPRIVGTPSGGKTNGVVAEAVGTAEAICATGLSKALN